MTDSQKILITGANGYLGAQLSLHLSSLGHRVTALCYPKAPADDNFRRTVHQIVEGSVADSALMFQLAQDGYDAVIHLVSLDHHQSQKATPDEALNINVNPCWTLLNAFVPKGLKTFIFFSTIHVYGALPPVHVAENRAVSPGNVYALTHSLSEQICEYYHKTTPANVVTVRLSNSYGHPVFADNNCWWLAVNDLCRSAFFEKQIRLLSDGSPQRDFIHGSDVCQAVAQLLEASDVKMEKPVFHISSSETYTLLELAAKVRDVFQTRYNVQIPVLMPDGSIAVDFDKHRLSPRYTIDNSALRNLGFAPSCSLENGINQLFQYFENQESHA